MKKVFLLLLLSLFTVSARAERPVVLIHGFLNSSHAMAPIGKQLRACGFDVCAWDYASRKFTFECNAHHLVQLLQDIACAHPGCPIDFVTHSVGAVVLKVALCLPGCPEEAKMGRAVFLAPPFQGSSLARRYCGNCLVEAALGPGIGCQLLHYSPCEMQALGCIPEGMPTLVLAGCRGNHVLFDVHNDGYLTVEETKLCGITEHRVLSMSHASLLTCRESIELIINFLLCGCGC